MSREWFRKSSWTAEDREDFFAHLERARPSSRGQYLRLQASHLQTAGLHREALELLETLFEKHPEQAELAIAHLQKAECLGALGRVSEAIEEFRAALHAEDEFPSAQTYAWIEFPWFAVKHHARQLYDEAVRTLGRPDRSPLFPVDRYRINAIHSLISDELGDAPAARDYARSALAAEAETRSGFRYHARLGLGADPDPEIHARVVALAR
ncbi:MAG TPA: tetratricopeptide repeat protein [Thermoanaerobaculia bacterium]|nr:tetratricopeptide repeat protein [Thermoanaerobaculia bacterium]